jgi:hypothetical protein
VQGWLDLASAYDDELIKSGRSSPHLTRTPQDLANIGCRSWQWIRGERLSCWVEPHQHVCAEVADPHLVLIIDIHGVRLWFGTGQPPLTPLIARWIEDGQLTGVPLTHPDATWQPWAPFGVDDITDGTVATVLGLMGLLLWLAAIGHLLVMITRSAALIVLAAVTPAAAAGLVSDAGRTGSGRACAGFSPPPSPRC